MGNFGKWIGGGLGWAVFGPLGALIGFVIGTVVDGASQVMQQHPQTIRHTTSGGFIMSLLVLIAAVMKADGKVMRSELEYARDFLRRNFGEQAAAEASIMLRDLLVQNIPVEAVCHQIADHMHYSARLQMLHFLFGIAAADNEVSEPELKLIEFIGRHLGITPGDLVISCASAAPLRV